MGNALKRTPLFEAHRSAGARLVPFAGYEMPVQYAGVLKEHAAVRDSVGVFDVSHMGELRMRGPGAVAFADSLVTNDVARLPVGRALYTLACDERGGVLDDLIVYRLAEEDLLVVCNAANHAKMAAHLGSRVEGQCDFADESEATALLAVQGPRAEAVLSALGAPPEVLALPRFGVVQAEIAGTPAVVARTGYTGEDGFELFVAGDAAPGLWDRLLEHDVAPIGLGARDTLRLEAALRLYGNDMDEQTDPFEAGLGWTVKLDRGDFLGKPALVERKRAGLKRKLVGLTMLGRGIARHGYPVLDDDGEPVGVVTSGSPGPTVGKNIALAFVPISLSSKNTRVRVEIRGKAVEAEVTPLPFYKRV